MFAFYRFHNGTQDSHSFKKDKVQRNGRNMICPLSLQLLYLGCGPSLTLDLRDNHDCRFTVTSFLPSRWYQHRDGISPISNMSTFANYSRGRHASSASQDSTHRTTSIRRGKDGSVTEWTSRHAFPTTRRLHSEETRCAKEAPHAA